MLKLVKGAKDLKGVFGVTPTDIDHLYRITKGFHEKDTLVISRVMQRIWIDECMSDNLKCFALFELGRWCGRFETAEEDR